MRKKLPKIREMFRNGPRLNLKEKIVQMWKTKQKMRQMFRARPRRPASVGVQVQWVRPTLPSRQLRWQVTFFFYIFGNFQVISQKSQLKVI